MKLPDEDISLLKTAIAHNRMSTAFSIESRGAFTFNAEIKGQLEEELRPLQELSKKAWYREHDYAELPKLTDFITIQKAEKMLRESGELMLRKRTYDEKVGILCAPTLFIPDLRYYRITCGLRSKPLTVAYIDIDDFGDFNSSVGHTAVDQEFLPRFMTTLESAVYPFATAYRYAGDEYVAILPNHSAPDATKRFEHFREELEGISLNNS